jgi:anti-sigma factor RsiW
VTRRPEFRCVEFVDSVTEWMEGALPDEARLTLEEHLIICPYCTRYLAQLRLSMQVLVESDRRQPTDAPPPSAREALLHAFRARRQR